VTDVVGYVSEIKTIVTKKSHKGTSIILYPDDMPYSGQQIAWEAFEMNKEKGWDKNCVLAPLIAYIGSRAKARLTEYFSNVYLEGVTELDSVKDILTKKYGEDKSVAIIKELQKRRYKIMYGITGEQTFVYFDHKLADIISVPARLIALGPVYDGMARRYESYPLIETCEDHEYKEGNRVVEDEIPLLREFDFDWSCPAAFYKNIKYVINGKKMTKNEKEKPLMFWLEKEYDEDISSETSGSQEDTSE